MRFTVSQVFQYHLLRVLYSLFALPSLLAKELKPTNTPILLKHYHMLHDRMMYVCFVSFWSFPYHGTREALSFQKLLLVSLFKRDVCVLHTRLLGQSVWRRSRRSW